MASVVTTLFLIILVLCLEKQLGFKKMLCNPALIFSFGFALSLLYGLLWVDRWNLDFDLSTMCVLVLGNFLFAFVVLSIETLLRKNLLSIKRNVIKFKACSYPFIRYYGLYILLFIQILTFGYAFYFFSSLPGDAIFAKIEYFRNSNLFLGEQLLLPKALAHLFYITEVWGYILVYLIALYNEKQIILGKRLIIIEIITSLIISLFSGSRGLLFRYAIEYIVMSYVFKNINKRFKFNIPCKIIFISFILCAVGVVLFFELPTILGRPIDFNIDEYIAIYLSAPLKNLDTFIKEDIMGREFLYWGTISSWSSLFSRWLDFHVEYSNDMIFRWENGYFLGNVYTIFWTFLRDAGYLGVLFFVTFMALISEIVYIHMLKNIINRVYSVPFSAILYSKIVFALFFAFFGDKFFSEVFDNGLIWLTFYFFLLRKIFLGKRHFMAKR